jgi:hypothetical protein
VIEEALGSNLCIDTGYPNRFFMVFFSVLPGKCWDSTSNLAMSASFYISANV